jgi:hypothetical protein
MKRFSEPYVMAKEFPAAVLAECVQSRKARSTHPPGTTI